MESTACTSIRKCPSCSGERAEILTGLRFRVFDDCPFEGSFFLYRACHADSVTMIHHPGQRLLRITTEEMLIISVLPQQVPEDAVRVK